MMMGTGSCSAIYMATAPISGEIRGALTKIGVATIDSRAADILGSLSYSRRVLQSAGKPKKNAPGGGQRTKMFCLIIRQSGVCFR